MRMLRCISPLPHTLKVSGAVRLIDAQGDILQQLAEKSVAELSGRDILPLLARKGAVVDGEVHFYGGLAYLDEGDGIYFAGDAKSIAYRDVLNAAETHDVTHFRLLDGGALQALDLEKGDHLALVGREPGIVAHHDLFAHPDLAALYLAYAYAPDVIVIVYGGHKQLQIAVGISLGRLDVVEYGLEKRSEIGARDVVVSGGGGVLAGAIEDGAHELLVVRAEVEQKFQHLVPHLRKSGVGTVYLVDDYDDPEPEFQRLFHHESGLRHGTLRRVHQEDDPAHHFEHALHLAGEIGVSRGVDDVDLHSPPMHGGVFGKDGDAALAFERAGIHDAGLHLLIVTEGARLTEHTVHQGGLAVIDVSDYCDVSEVMSYHTLPSARLRHFCVLACTKRTNTMFIEMFSRFQTRFLSFIPHRGRGRNNIFSPRLRSVRQALFQCPKGCVCFQTASPRRR